METVKKDYKEKFGDSALKTLCAFANTEGGEVVIGINNDGEVMGVDLDNEERSTRRLQV